MIKDKIMFHLLSQHDTSPESAPIKPHVSYNQT